MKEREKLFDKIEILVTELMLPRHA